MVNIVVTMIASTMFLVWLGELITERGVGNGISIIIFAGIVTDVPGIVGRGIIAAVGGNPGGLVAYIILALAMIVLIIVFVEAHRRIPVQYARSTFRRGRMYRQSGSTYIPLRVNIAGMVPLIFAIALMQLPGTIATYFMNPTKQDPNLWNRIYNMFQAGNPLYEAGYASVLTGPLWVRRFNEKGIAGLEDQPRPGRQPTHDQQVHSQLISLATQKPSTLGYPFTLWTLERLQAAFQERHNIHLADSTIWEWLAAEGLEWKRQESWFHEAEKHDPEFVEKRGVSSQPT